jgi:ATP-dependent DNA helicase RecQ
VIQPGPGPLFQDVPARPIATASDLDGALHRLFGFTAFRPGQREVIEAVLAGRDAIAVMPTGGGKSLTYLLPAFVRDEGVTVVVSPLISLMQDQHSKLVALGLPAAALNSQVPYAERCQALAGLRDGSLRLLFVAPERFRDRGFMAALAEAKVNLLAVDEAHCVSQWGHDFRPDYLTLDAAARACGRPPILAVTATATDQVRQDIAVQLGQEDSYVLVRGFDRPNLFLSTVPVFGGRQVKLRALFAVLRRAPKGPGIVYCSTRKNVERVAKAVRAADLGRVAAYHAGMTPKARDSAQRRFFGGKVDVIVATNAFGLGIDKQDLRFVVHHDLPGSLEAYYQEAGRAGRDGSPAECSLVFAPQDIHLQKFFIRTSHPERALVQQVAWAVERGARDPDRIARKLPGSASGRAVESALRLLEQADGNMAAIDFAAVEARARHEDGLLQAMIRYAKGGRCRRRAILAYFDAPELPRGCEACDVCRPPVRAAKAKASSSGASAGKAKARKPRKPRKPRQDEASLHARAIDADAELVQRLRALRGKLAKRGRVPAYKVFHDKTLLSLAVTRPTCRDELLAVHGIGEAKAKRYGDQVLELIRTFAE